MNADNLSPKAISAWLRARANKYLETANAIDEDFDSAGQIKPGRIEQTFSEAGRTTPLTVEELEKAVRERSGRVNDLALRLRTTPTQITSLLHPASKVYMAERGWLKIKQ